MDASERALLQEAVDRTRRIETRQAKHLTALGFETGARKPIWKGGVVGVVEVPSLATSLVDIISVIPELWDDEVEVEYREQRLGWVLRP